MQAVAWMIQNLGNSSAEKFLQTLRKTLTDQARRWAFSPFRRVEALSNIVTLKPLKSLDRVIQTSRRHAPGAYRCTNQIDWMVTLHQPVTKNEPIQRPENQPLGPTCRSRYDFDHIRLQALLLKQLPGLAASIDT